MFDRVRQLILTLLKVPPEPHPPLGSPGSLRVFRAGRNYFRLRLLGWGIGQAAALAGIIFWVVVLLQVEDAVRQRRQQSPPPLTVESLARSVEGTDAEPVSTGQKREVPQTPRKKRNQVRIGDWNTFKQILVELGSRLPAWSFPLIWLLKIGGFLAYLAQVPVTFMLRRLDYEMRWYMVTDRSLRLRSGTWKIQEATMSFANLQQVEVTQDPIQRLLGLADVRVQSAGGGGNEHEKHGDDSMHRARFHGVENAGEIRDLILERLRRYRSTGLGDSDDHRDDTPVIAPAGDPGLLAAARELAAEARALRLALD